MPLTHGPELPRQDQADVKTIEAHPASVHDLLIGMHRNHGGQYLRNLVDRWPSMSYGEKQQTIAALLSAPWVPQSTKNALRAAYG